MNAALNPKNLIPDVDHAHLDALEELGGLMPRYALGEAELQSLKAYLETLSAQWSPGVDRDTIRIATVVAPGVDAIRFCPYPNPAPRACRCGAGPMRCLRRGPSPIAPGCRVIQAASPPRILQPPRETKCSDRKSVV